VREPRCQVVVEEGERFLIPGCWGAVHGSARGCYCDPIPPAVARLARVEEAEEEARSAAKHAERVAREEREQAEREERDAAVEEWVARGGRPRLLGAP